MATRRRAVEEPPPGLVYVPAFLSADEEHDLLDAIAPLPFHEVVMRGVAAKRTVVHFGWDYGYESWSLSPAPPLPDFLRHLRMRVAALAALDPAALEQVLVARYPPGAAIGWHRDAPMFGPTVVGVSLGAPATMRFRRRVAGAFETFRLSLPSRSAYVLGGAARASWQHSLAPATSMRYSITYRTVRDSARR